MKKILFYLLLGAHMVSCSPEEQNIPLTSDSRPGPVSNVEVKAIPGGALITYDVPEDQSVRYVKAEFNIRDGYSRETKSSLYSNSVKIDGFPKVAEYEVKLYAVSRGENVSEPVSVIVTPLEPPLIEAIESLQFKETFGGVTVTFNNSGEASLAVNLLAEDADGNLQEIETYYTQSVLGNYSMRGFPAEPKIFGAVVRDRWGNLSDTVIEQVTPIFEELIPKDSFVALNLPSDTYEPHATSAWNLTKLWDDVVEPNGGHSIFHSIPGSGMPQWFTIDMGRQAHLSRYKLYHRGPGALQAYQNGAPKRWEVWGSASEPDPTGSWEGWTKLMDCVSFKPSGEGPVTNEDIQYATVAGEDFTFPEGTPPVRYLRFKILETWGYVDYIYLAELTFYGELQ